MKLKKNDAIDANLRREGAQARIHGPAFSPDLHKRVMGALRAEGLSPEEETENEGRWHWTWRMAVPLGVAAAVAAATWTVMVRQTQITTPPTKEMVREELPAMPKIGDPIRQMGSPAADALEGGKYAYLDRDAQRLAIFVADQFPTFQPAGVKH